eukprot:03169_4
MAHLCAAPTRHISSIRAFSSCMKPTRRALSWLRRFTHRSMSSSKSTTAHLFSIWRQRNTESQISQTPSLQSPGNPPQPPPWCCAGSYAAWRPGWYWWGEEAKSGSGRPKGSKDKTQRRPRSAAAQEFEKEVVGQLTQFCGADDASKWNAKKPAIDALKASPMWDSWSKAGLNEQQLVQFVHRLKA